MTQDEIIRMAREADDYADDFIQMPGEYHPDWHTVRDERFAALVEQRVRSEIALDELAKISQELGGY